ncbi:MAG: ABC transporter permease, partial [Actinomycetota bacterium]|nr:ABC transporter permease [Actinomycetota bacterium]
ALACVILPSLTATSINGERDRGTLAVLQATLLRPWEIVAAKLIAAMITAAAFIATTIPIALWSMSEGGVGVGRTVAVYATLLAVSLVLVASALAASGIARRPALSAVLSYGLVFFLTIGTLILFGVSMATAPQDPETFEIDPGARWLILAPNPFVVLADAAPRSEGRRIDDPLSGMREAIRLARDPQPFVAPSGGLNGPEPAVPPEPAPVWPTGLAIELVLASVAFYLATERLRVPARRLAAGERIA